MFVRKLVALVVVSVPALGVAACGTEPAPAAAPASVAPAASSPTASRTTSVPASAPTSAPTTAPTGKATAKPACPATEADLRAALKRPVDNGVSAKSRLTKIVCYRDYAIATVPERPTSDEQYVVFKHASGSWSFHAAGSGAICPGVPAEVAEHFRGARYGACG